MSTTFSYAQAARGPAPSALPTPPLAATSAPPSVSSLSKDDAQSTTAPSSQDSIASDLHEPLKPAQADAETIVRNTEAVSAPVDVSSTVAPATTQTAETAVVEPVTSSNESVMADSAAQTSSTSGSQAGEQHKGKNSRKASKNRSQGGEKDAKPAEAEEKEIPKPTYHEAPIPTVNPWQQRAQARSALNSTKSQSSAVNTTKPADSRKPAPTSHEDSANGDGASGSRNIRRPSEATRGNSDAARRGGLRGNRLSDRDARAVQAETMPSVKDSYSWPTPVTAASAEDGKPKSKQEKSDEQNASDNSAPLKPRAKRDWVPMPIQPSVVFQTPMPTRGGPKSRGGARGGREVNSRGGHAAASGSSPTEKQAPNTTTNGPVKATQDARERHGEASAPPSKRFSMDGASGKDVRKPSVASVSEKKDSAQDNSASGKPEAAKNGRGEILTNGDHQHLPSRNSTSDRRGEGAQKGHEARAERAERGGRYRGGRGGHAGQGHGSQGPYHPNSSRYQGFSPNAAQNGLPQGPPGQQYTQSFGSGSSRPSKNRPAVSHLATGSARPPNGVPNYPHPGSVPFGGYMPEYAPYGFGDVQQPILEANHIISGLVSQLNYYFSEENLFKDEFLKQRMDSQGFVPFRVIADFRRLQGMAPDVNWIKAAILQSGQHDFFIDYAGQEWVRARHHWQKFVLPEDARAPEARVPGPDLRYCVVPQFFPPSMPFVSPPINGYEQGMGVGPMGGAFDGSFANGYMPDQFAHGPNGDSAHSMPSAASQLSATVEPFSPTQGGYQTGSGAPVTLEDFQTCSDDQIANLVIQLKQSGADSYTVQALVPNGVNGHASDSEHTADDAHSKPNGVAPVNGEKTSSLVEETTIAQLRSKALEHRSKADGSDVPDAMKQLYSTWADVLPKSFNVQMYNEFRLCALEDAKQPTPRSFGLDRLLAYYRGVHSEAAEKPCPAIFNSHRAEAEEIQKSQGVEVNGIGQH